VTAPFDDGGAAARARLREDLLAWGRPRPAIAAAQVEQLRSRLERQLADVDDELGAALAVTGRQHLLVTKTRLARLVCDGYASAPAPFEHTEASVRGVLAHKVVERHLDTAAVPGRSDDEVVAAAWRELAAREPGDPRSVSAWLNACSARTADRLRREVSGLLATFVEVWPAPAEREAVVQTERRLEVPLADGRVRLRGHVDLVVDSPLQDGHARALLLDLKTGIPRPTEDRAEVRFSALLWTLATGRPPFRWASFSVPEGRPASEDLDLGVLAATADRVVAVVRQEARLPEVERGATPPRLHAGRWCGRCRLRDGCPEAARTGTACP
jgi:RecB family exonuclease